MWFMVSQVIPERLYGFSSVNSMPANPRGTAPMQRAKAGRPERLKEADLAKHAGVYKGEKRKKELLRQKKQEEKKQKRLQKTASQKQDSESTPPISSDEGTEQSGSGTPQGNQ